MQQISNLHNLYNNNLNNRNFSSTTHEMLKKEMKIANINCKTKY